MVQLQGARNSSYSRVPDHYKILGLAPNATFGEIQRAYWRVAFGGLNAADRAALNEAYDVLGNDRRRREYDALRANAGLDHDETSSAVKPSEPAPRPDAGLRGKLGWPSS